MGRERTNSGKDYVRYFARFTTDKITDDLCMTPDHNNSSPLNVVPTAWPPTMLKLNTFAVAVISDSRFIVRARILCEEIQWFMTQLNRKHV